MSVYYPIEKEKEPQTEKTVKEALCSLRAKNLLNSKDIAESEENGIPILQTVDVVHIKPVELDKNILPSNLNSQQTWQKIISNPLIPFSVYTPTPARIINTKKDPLCYPQPINLVNSQLTYLENKRCGKIMTMMFYFMDELHSKNLIVKTKLKIQVLLM